MSKNPAYYYFSLEENFSAEKLISTFLPVPAKNCCKRKRIWKPMILVLRISPRSVPCLLDLTKLWRSRFINNSVIIVKGLRDLGKGSDWFHCKNVSQKMKYFNFKCELSERYFISVLLVSSYCTCPTQKI